MAEIGTLSPAALPRHIGVDDGINISYFAPQSKESRSRPEISIGITRKVVSSREDWETLKSLIRRLYLDENMTREAVTKHIAVEHKFLITKRQFNRKISEWGFEKNTKKAERISVLASIRRQNGIETTTIRGRKLDQAKIERWSKQDGAMLQPEAANGDVVCETSAFTAKPTEDIRVNSSTTSGATYRSPTESDAEKMDVDTSNTRTIADDRGSPPSIWESIDIVGSPRLTGLLGVLSLHEIEPFTLDCSITTGVFELETELDDLDSKAQDKNNGSSPSNAIASLDLSGCTPKSLFIPAWTTQDAPNIGLSPFPATEARTNLPSFDFSSLDEVRKYSEAECIAKMCNRSKMKPVHILDLADSMSRIAKKYYDLYDFQSALIWYRRIIRLKQQKRVRQLRPTEIIYACLNVIMCLRNQGAYAEAQTLLRNLHEKTLALFSAHNVAIASRDAQAWLLGDCGDVEEEEAIRREILQIQLSKFGPTSRQGVHAMSALSTCLTRRKAFSQSEHLIRTGLQLQSQLLGHRSSEKEDVVFIFERQIDLAKLLNRAKRYLEAEQLLRYINTVFPDLASINNKISFQYHLEIAEMLNSQSRFGESEKIYQDLLNNQGVSLHPGRRATVMHWLAIILEQSGRGSEAAVWYKKTFDSNIEAYGPEQGHSLDSCMELGFCYVRQGRFDEAVSHFEQMTSKIELLRKEGDELLSENVEKIRGWIVEVDTNRCKAIGFEHVDDGLFDEAILHFQHHIDWLVEAQMNHRMSPVYDAAAKGINRVKRWISMVVIDQCKAVGFGLADNGLFNDAILHFQQYTELLAEPQNDLAAGNVGGSPAGSIERIKRWISIVKMDQCKAIGFVLAKQGHFEEAIEYFQQIEAELVINGTVSDSNAQSLERVQRWISTVKMDQCKAIGFGLANEGLFDEAVAHFQRIETELAKSESIGSEIVPASNAKSIVRVRRWISNVVNQEMAKWKATGYDYVDQGLLDQAVLHYQQAMEKVSNAKLVDSGIDVYYGCEERIQRWMSKAYALKSLGSCLEIGIGFANEGNFDNSLQHFQQAMDEIDLNQEYETHYRTECIKVLQHHIQEVEKWRAESVEEGASEPASGDSGQDVEME